MLKKIVFILRKENVLTKIDGLLQELAAQGIEVCFVEGEDSTECGRDLLTVEDWREDIQGKDGEILYITDYAECQKELQSRGAPVLIYLHENNREETFSFVEYAIENLEEIEYRSLELAWRRLTGKPWMIVETARCVIRETTIEDVDSFYEIYKEPSITEYMEDLYADRDEEIAYVEDYIKNVYGFYGYGMWTVLEKESGRVIGRAGLTLREGYDMPELGFVIGVPWQGQGYALEVCRAILKYGKEELAFTTFQAMVMSGNHKSEALCQKLGFAYRETVEIEGDEYVRMVLETGK
ncbi:MAG: GNAT family N-acetyltransferase [Ruminococcus sp.]|nr:GNAT family N-acetyltransferase [Ruminococcus sp.]